MRTPVQGRQDGGGEEVQRDIHGDVLFELVMWCFLVDVVEHAGIEDEDVQMFTAAKEGFGRGFCL
jgi:energy-converting hydrogenase A subunit M